MLPRELPWAGEGSREEVPGGSAGWALGSGGGKQGGFGAGGGLEAGGGLSLELLPGL